MTRQYRPCKCAEPRHARVPLFWLFLDTFWELLTLEAALLGALAVLSVGRLG